MLQLVVQMPSVSFVFIFLSVQMPSASFVTACCWRGACARACARFVSGVCFFARLRFPDVATNDARACLP